MNFTAAKADLLNALQKTHTIVASKSTLSILANVLIETAEEKLIFTTTNLQVGIRCQAPAQIASAGATTLPARFLFAIVRELVGAEVQVEVDENNVAAIRCGESFFRLLGISKEEFPKVAEFEGDPLFSIPQKNLKEMLRKTSFAVSREDPRHFLTGMYFVIADGQLLLVGTDGRRLSRMTHPVSTKEGYTGNFIVPIKAIEELEKMLTEDGDADVHLSGNQVGFRLGTDLLVSLLIDARFPDYEGVIPKTSAATVVLNREELAATVRQAALVASEQSSSVSLRFKSGELVISARSPEIGEARVAMPAKYAGEELAVGFNPDCLRDVLRFMDEEEITLQVTDSLSPGVITGEGSFLHLIMPMRLPEGEG
jgi:DNA polymerase III subunit beta